jgi:hypothetical protein
LKRNKIRYVGGYFIPITIRFLAILAEWFYRGGLRFENTGLVVKWPIYR